MIKPALFRQPLPLPGHAVQPPRPTSAMRLALLSLLVSLPVPCALATTWYVNARSGHDNYGGIIATQPFLTINHACQVVQPGDTVIIYPGIYFENVALWKLGTPTQPITFKGYTRVRDTEIITGADPAFRAGTVPWTLLDPIHNIYTAPCAWLPARVLYNNVDLYPYTSLTYLQNFTTDDMTPGPLHGFYYDATAKLLYVRLNAKYGSLNPGQHVMMVSPPNGGGITGKIINVPSDANFCIHQPGSGNIIFDGLTFETPGVAGIATKASDITVQDCFFVGCRTGVYGLGDPTVAASSIDNVVIQYCEYTLFPTFDDVTDIVDTAYANPQLESSLKNFFWWQRKTIPLTYELGLVLGVGANWKIRNNYIHDVVDAISGYGTSFSTNLEVSNNLIQHTIDNAVEGKSHPVNLLVHDNVMLDCFEAITYQPLEGTPWPTSITIAHNVIADAQTYANPWKHMPWERGAFKFVIDPANWNFPYMANVSKTSLVIPGSGFVANNNTVLQYNGNVFNLGGIDPLVLSNVHMINNLMVGYYAFSLATRGSTTFNFSGFDCQGNMVAPASDNASGPGARVAGAAGYCLQLYSQAGLTDPFKFNFSPRSGSPLLGAGVSYSGGYNPSTDVGAYSTNGPTTLPVAGIQPDPVVP